MGFRMRLLGTMAAALGVLASASANAQVNVTTYHNDNARTGQNTNETTLTPANVNSTTFGKLFTNTVDGVVYAQPLYMSNVGIGGGTHNVLYVATQHDSVYAIDADTGTVYWQTSLIPAGGSTVSSSVDLNCGDISVEVGITGTPVIDPATATLYVVAKVKLNGVILQYLHALDITTGTDKFGGPTSITATVAGNASDGDGSIVAFNTRQENQRAALLLENGHVIIGWTAHCDKIPWHGWIISYSASTLTQEGIYMASPNGYGNGIWMSGGGPAADATGNIYFATGNGSWNATDLGDSVVKLGQPSGATLPVLDSFTPYNQGSLASVDSDLSSGGLILLPTLANGQQLLAIMGKQGNIYLLDRNNLGKYCITQTPACTNTNPQIVQEVDGALTGLWGVPAFWNGNLYWGGGNDNTGAAEALKAYSFNAGGSGKISTAATSVSAKLFNFSGPVPSISSNGTSNAILWGIDDGRARSTCVSGSNCQVLYAYDATNLNTMLYNSSQAANLRDVPGTAVKFVTPTVANGKVYVGSADGVSAYGLLNNVSPVATAPTITPTASTYTSAQSVTMADATPNAVIYYTTDGSTPTTGSAKYTAAINITATTTVKALAAASGYTNSAVSSSTITISSTTSASGSITTPVSLAGTFNVYGIDTDGAAATNGGLDTHGFSYSGTQLGTSITWNNVTFTLSAAGGASAVSNTTITLPAGNYSTLNLLASGVNGAQLNQKFLVTYTDGSTTTITQSLSDWFTPVTYTGESIAKTMAYRLTATGATDNRTFYLYGYAFAINAAKTVKSLTLPANRSVVVLATELLGTATTATTTSTTSTTTPVSLSAAANVNALFTDGTAVSNGGIDTHSDAASENLVGTSVTASGVTYSLLGGNVLDAVTETTVTLPAGNFSTLNLLATAVNGTQTAQPFVVTYTDGTTTTVTQSLSDWFTPQSYGGESTAVTMAYRLLPTGAKDARTFYFYAYSLTINNAKTVKTLTLPANRHIVVLAATLNP
jgi:hypothetical protein